jgi:putative flippase GtrA
MEKIKALIKKICTKEVILYALFGVLTTVVNIGSFTVLTKIVKLDENLSNAIAIILAVLVAYITNKDAVFHSKANTFLEKAKEFFKFIIGRAFTMVIEFIGCLILFKLPIPEIISKCAVTVIVIILNFFISKFFAFKK